LTKGDDGDGVGDDGDDDGDEFVSAKSIFFDLQ